MNYLKNKNYIDMLLNKELQKLNMILILLENLLKKI